MTEYTVVVPSVVASFTDICFASMHPDMQARVLRIDNDGAVNLGVAASWNLGVAHARERGDDYLVVCSAAMQFGVHQGTDFVRELSGDVVEAASVGWHLIAFHVSVFDRIGLFDENFYPAYFEDNDFGYRLALSDVDTPWKKPGVDARLAMFGHAIKLGEVLVDSDKNRRYYSAKWGGPPSSETFTTPFNRGGPISEWEKE